MCKFVRVTSQTPNIHKKRLKVFIKLIVPTPEGDLSCHTSFVTLTTVIKVSNESKLDPCITACHSWSNREVWLGIGMGWKSKGR